MMTSNNDDKIYWKSEFKEEDLIKLIEFDKLVHPERDWVTFAEYQFWIKNGLQVYMLVNENDEFIGCYQTLESPKEVIFHGFGVIPTIRNQGYGQFIIDRIIQNHHQKYIICKTRPNNHYMKRLLDKNGFINKLDEIVDGGEYWTWWTKSPGY